MKIVSWNCNFFNGRGKKSDALDILLKMKPDVVCIQEPTTKASYKAVEKSSLEPCLNAVSKCKKNNEEKYECFYKEEAELKFDDKVYRSASTITFVRKDILITSKEIPITSGPYDGVEEYKNQGLVTTVKFPNFFLINVYFPCSWAKTTETDKTMEKFQSFAKSFIEYVKKLEVETKKSVVITGDFNINHEKIQGAMDKPELDEIICNLSVSFDNVLHKLKKDRNCRKSALVYFFVSKSNSKNVKKCVIHTSVLESIRKANDCSCGTEDDCTKCWNYWNNTLCPISIDIEFDS